MHMLIGSLAVLVVGAVASLWIARAFNHRKLTYMANSGSAVGPEWHKNGMIPMFADSTFLAAVAAAQTAGYGYNGRYLLCKASDEETVTIPTNGKDAGVFGVCFDEPDTLSTTAPRAFTVAVLGNVPGTIPVAVGGSVGPNVNSGYVVASTDGTVIALPANGSGNAGIWYVVGRVRRAHVQGDFAELYHCVPYAITVS